MDFTLMILRILRALNVAVFVFLGFRVGDILWAWHLGLTQDYATSLISTVLLILIAPVPLALIELRQSMNRDRP
jgi:hypothetical protein